MKKQLIFFALITIVSCTAKKPTDTEVKVDSMARVLDKLNVKVETMPLSSFGSISRSEVNTLIAASAKIANDKIAAQAVIITKLIADTVLKSKQIKSLKDTVDSYKVDYSLDYFGFNAAKKFTITPVGIANIKAQVKTP